MSLQSYDRGGDEMRQDNQETDIQKFKDLGARNVRFIDGQLHMEAPPVAIRPIMAALTPNVPIIE